MSSTLKINIRRDTFVLTLMKLTMKENTINSTFGSSLASLALSMIQGLNEDSDSDLNLFVLSAIGFIVKFYEGIKEQKPTKVHLL